MLSAGGREKKNFVDDTNLEDKISKEADDVQRIIDSHQHTDLHLHSHKCDISLSLNSARKSPQLHSNNWKHNFFPKAVHIAAEEKRTSIKKHVLGRVIFVPDSVPFQTTPNLQFLACRLRAGGS